MTASPTSSGTTGGGRAAGSRPERSRHRTRPQRGQSEATMVARISGWLVMALALVVLSGCASMQTQFAREAELVAARGEPHRIWDNPDGTRTYEYSTQPNGSSTWMYTIDANGSIVEQHDALSPRNRARVERGMSKDEVARLLGEHDSVQIYRRLN